jgi:hypothetical protein
MHVAVCCSHPHDYYQAVRWHTKTIKDRRMLQINISECKNCYHRPIKLIPSTTALNKPGYHVESIPVSGRQRAWQSCDLTGLQGVCQLI